jgi:predicted ATPase
MADEPELSHHIDWQESLAVNIKSLNPAAQIIFATHSPDVVGVYQDYVSHMEDCIK